LVDTRGPIGDVLVAAVESYWRNDRLRAAGLPPVNYTD